MTVDLVVRGSATPTHAEDPLLASKFAIPEPPMFMVPRPRLIRQIPTEGPERITVVTGPAGSGKTQLVAAWASHVPASDRVVWISLEEEDGAEHMFWTYVLEGFRRAGLTFPPDSRLWFGLKHQRAPFPRLPIVSRLGDLVQPSVRPQAQVAQPLQLWGAPEIACQQVSKVLGFER